MFKDEDLRAEIEEMFAGEQARFAESAVQDMLTPRVSETDAFSVAARKKRTDGSGRSHGYGTHIWSGFRIYHPNPPLTEHRKAYKRRHQSKLEKNYIRQALQAGELPAWRPGKPGRPPKRWLEAAAALGMDLRALCAAAAATETRP